MVLILYCGQRERGKDCEKNYNCGCCNFNNGIYRHLYWSNDEFGRIPWRHLLIASMGAFILNSIEKINEHK